MRFAVAACVLLACADDGPLQAPTGKRVRYVLSGFDLPRSNTQARLYGLDVNGDRTIDNQLGMVMSTIAGMGLEPSLDSQLLVDRGELITLVEVQYARDSDPDDSVAVTLYDGGEPWPWPCADALDTTCGHHLNGEGAFSVLAAQTVPMLGQRGQPPIVVGPQTLTTSVPCFGEVVDLELTAARLRIDQVHDLHLTGSIGGGLRRIEITRNLIPAFQRYLERLLARDCATRTTPPLCGCTTEVARDWLARFDSNPKDCNVTLHELLTNSLVVSAIDPDVTIDGEELLSVGIHFEAVPAVFY